MVHNTEQPEQETERPPSTEEYSEPTPQSNSSTSPLIAKKKSFLCLFNPFIALSALAIALYNSHQTTTASSIFEKEQQKILVEMNQLKQQQSNGKEQSQKIANEQNQLEDKINQLKQHTHTALQQKSNQNQDWLLLKARYYLELAQINAHWSENDQSTTELLQQTDTLLGQMNSTAVFEIRQIIAKEMTQLNATKRLDLVGILSQLSAIQEGIAQLSIDNGILHNDDSTPQTPSKETVSSAWNNTHWQNSLNLLGKLVVIRRTDEDIKPLLSPLYESTLKEIIALDVQEAQWAILNKNSSVYQLALKQSIKNLSRGFNADAPPVAALIKQLTDLQKININQQKPLIGQALPLINKMIEQDTSSAVPTDKGAQ